VVETHVHKETGNTYQFLFYTNRAATKDGWLVQAVYIDGNGDIWSRDENDFLERFEEIK